MEAALAEQSVRLHQSSLGAGIDALILALSETVI